MKTIPAILGELVIFLICCVFTYQLLSTPTPWTFLDGADLFFHEAGHLIFSFFGDFIHVLAGSAFQVLLPTFFAIYFLVHKQYFEMSFAVFWIGENLIDVSVYIKDSIAMVLPLLGGEGSGHDWNWLLTTMNLLPQTYIIGQTVFIFGTISVFLGLIFMLLFICLDLQKKYYD